MKPKIVVITPTYNERDNVGKLIPMLAEVFAKLPDHNMQLLVVDDTSPDGTAEVVRGLQTQYTWVHLLMNKGKQGLGAAYAKGMQYAISELKADAFIEFDGDLQHNPHDIPKLVVAFDQGADYVIASRYIKGGSIPDEWNFDRKFLSVVGNWVARLLLLVPKIHDVTGGFKLTRVKGYGENLSFDNLISKQFAYKIQFLFEMVQMEAQVVEVPTNFRPRELGESKLMSNEMVETLRVIFMLQMNNPKMRQFVKFGIVGAIGYVVQATSLYMLSRFDLAEWVLWGGSAELAIISNFTINNLWTFKSHKISGFKILLKFLQFNASSVGAIIIQMVAGSVLVHWFGAEHRQLYLPLIIVTLVIPYNYLMYTRIIWKTNKKRT